MTCCVSDDVSPGLHASIALKCKFFDVKGILRRSS